jgi:DnaD/phage-associated family protein
MAWARIDDKFLDNPKVRKAGKEATYLYLSGLVYSSNQITEGYISDEVLGLVAFKGFIRNELTHADKLVECGLWDRIDGGYLIHDYLEYNPTKEQIEESRAKKIAAGSKGGRATAVAHAQAHATAHATAQLQQEGSINPSHPIPIPIPVKNTINQSSSIAEKGDDDDGYLGFQAIAACTPQVKKAIDQAVSTYGAAWVKDAITEAVIREAKSFAYVSKILASWKANGKPSNGNKSGDTKGSYEYFKQLRKGAK